MEGLHISFVETITKRSWVVEVVSTQDQLHPIASRNHTTGHGLLFRRSALVAVVVTSLLVLGGLTALLRSQPTSNIWDGNCALALCLVLLLLFISLLVVVFLWKCSPEAAGGGVAMRLGKLVVYILLGFISFMLNLNWVPNCMGVLFWPSLPIACYVFGRFGRRGDGGFYRWLRWSREQIAHGGLDLIV